MNFRCSKNAPHEIEYAPVDAGVLNFVRHVLLMMLTTTTAYAGLDVTGMPDRVTAVTDGPVTLDWNDHVWAGGGVTVKTDWAGDGLNVSVASRSPIKTMLLHWAGGFPNGAVFLGDAWERAYGELQWKPADHYRPMPWYFLASTDAGTDGFGVMAGPNSFCCWRTAVDGVELTIDVRSGGVGVELGSRTLDACTVVRHSGSKSESPFAAATAFCKTMCPHPRLPSRPVYGFNDWYCKYGHNTAESFLADAKTIADLSPAGDNRPFMVVDDGWQGRRQGDHSPADPWDHTNEKFGSDMAALAKGVKAMNGRPGLWYRPLQAWPDAPVEWRMKAKPDVLDPSVPAVRQRIAQHVDRFKSWGFEMVKHDFSTWEIAGKWGNQMGGQVAADDWSFADRSRTTAEIILEFYRTIRSAAGDGMVVNGCNTVSHLSAGIFEMARVGDDTSGQEWPRTKEMGVNCLAFRAPQNMTFYAIDPDCAGLATAGAVPWEKNRQWLDLLGRSGTPTFVSWPTHLIGPDESAALKDALSNASKPRPTAEPVDWLRTKTPALWKLNGQDVRFKW